MIVNSRNALTAVMLFVVAGCPVGPPDTGVDATGMSGDLPSLDAIAGSAAEAGGDALGDLVLQAARDRFPPAPELDTLCQLRADNTNFNEAKKILGEPQAQSQDATMAGLSYRYRPADMAGGVGGHGGAGGSAADEEAEPITLFLTFAWSDGDVGWGTKLFGIGGSPEDFLKGYILRKMSVSGMPYPACWPHEEE